MNRELEHGVIGILDVARLELQRRNVAIFDRNPIWRWLWNRLKRIDVEVRFVELQGESKEHMEMDGFDTLIVYIDNYIPEWLKKELKYIFAGGKKAEVYFCGYLPTIKKSELQREFSGGINILQGTLERILGDFCRRVYVSKGEVFEECYEYPEEGVICETDREEYRNLFFPGQVGIVQSSVGCPRRCLFCRYSEYYRTWGEESYVQFPMWVIVSQMKEMVCRYDIHFFRFLDSNFLGVGRQIERRMEEFIQQVNQQDLKAIFAIHCRSDVVSQAIISELKTVGLRYVTIGIESMSESQLKRLGKQEITETHWSAVKILEKEGLHTQAYIILADPLVTRKELIESLEGICELCKSVQIVMNEKLVLYSDSLYYKKYGTEIDVNGTESGTLGNVLRYSFVDEWCKKYYGYLEETSTSLKEIIMEEAQRRKVGESYLRKATFYRMRALLEIVKTDILDKKRVSSIRQKAVKRIQSERQ